MRGASACPGGNVGGARAGRWGGGRSQVHGLLLACEQAVGGGRHGLDVNLWGEQAAGWWGPGLGGGVACPAPPAATHLGVCLGEQLDDAGVRRGHHAVPVDLNDAVAHTDTPTLGDAAAEEAADLGEHEGPRAQGAARGATRPHPGPCAGASRCRPRRRSPAALGRGAGG